MTCSQLFHNILQHAHDLFLSCSGIVHLSNSSFLLGHNLFTTWSQLVHDFFTTCSNFQNWFKTCSWLFYNFFIIFSQLVHNSLRTCSFVYYFLMTCSQLVHILYLSCPVSTTCSHLCHNFSKILSSYFHKSVFVRFPKFKITLILILKRARYCQPPDCLLILASFQDDDTSSPKNH